MKPRLLNRVRCAPAALRFDAQVLLALSSAETAGGLPATSGSTPTTDPVRPDRRRRRSNLWHSLPRTRTRFQRAPLPTAAALPAYWRDRLRRCTGPDHRWSFDPRL